MSAMDEWARREAILSGFDLDGIEDHGAMRWRNGRVWDKGFLAISDRGFIWVETAGAGTQLEPVAGWVGLPYSRIAGYRGFDKIVTADLFLLMDTGEKLRFNGGKRFVWICCHVLSRKGIPSPRRP